MHDAIKIIWLPERVDLPWLHLEEVILLAWGPHRTASLHGLLLSYICKQLLCYHKNTNTNRFFTKHCIHKANFKWLSLKRYGILRLFIKIEQCSSDMFLNINLGQVWYTAMSCDLTPVRLSCGAEECVAGKDTWGDFTVIKSLIHTHTGPDTSVNLKTHTHKCPCL